MKKQFLVVAVMAGLLFSCNKEETDMTVKTSSMNVTIASDQPTTASRTDVKRGNIYAWVKDVTIEAESSMTTYTAQESYDLLDTGDAGFSDAAGGFQLNDVALGQNLVIASTTSNVSPITEYDSTGDESVQTKADYISSMIDENPYALYATDAPVSVNVLPDGTTAPVQLQMNTQNARLISAISMNATNANAAYLTADFTSTSKVEIKEVGGSWTLVDESVITDELYSTFYWSDTNSIGGAKYRVTVTVVRNSDGQQMAQADRVVTLVNSTSYRCNFVMNVDSNDLFGDVELDLIWQEWIEAPCPGC